MFSAYVNKNEKRTQKDDCLDSEEARRVIKYNIYTVYVCFIIYLYICTLSKVPHLSTSVAPAGHSGQLVLVVGVEHSHGAATVSLQDDIVTYR